MAGDADESAGATSHSASIPPQAAAQSGERNAAHSYQDEQMAGDADESAGATSYSASVPVRDLGRVMEARAARAKGELAEQTVMGEATNGMEVAEKEGKHKGHKKKKKMQRREREAEKTRG